MIYFENVSKIYPDRSEALTDINLGIESQEFVSIVGHSGAGKTTLLKVLLAEENPTTGSVFFGSADIHNLKRSEMNELRRRVGTIFQDFRLVPDKTVFENVAFAMEVAGRTDEEIQSDVPHALDLVDLAHKAWSFPHQLSGGEKQRVAIARALINQPDVLVADEPTGNLDPELSRDIMALFEQFNQVGVTVLVATHDLDLINRLSYRQIVLHHGRLAVNKRL